MKIQAFTILSVVSLGILSVSASAAEPDPKGIAFFEKKIRPVLVKHCYQCHSTTGKKPKGGLLLDTREGTRKGGETGHAVVPGNVKESLLIAAIQHTGDVSEMPPKQKLPDDVIADFVRWVKMGAPDPRVKKSSLVKRKINFAEARKFWAFVPPKLHDIPKVKQATWPKTPIDQFLLSRMESNGLKPVGDASRESLIRRATFDLTGLPPTPAEIRAFVNDTSPKAFEKVIDRLLASKQFGERWGRHWLDVVRFAESTGKERNYLYPFAWRYRNYVIDSFNANKPYDQFVREQIAGDLLPAKNDTVRDEQIIATGFLAFGPKSLNERNRLKFQMDEVDDQIDVTGRAILGMTIACARCHDHKFDPIPTTDYYALAGIFRSTQVISGVKGRRGVRNGGNTAGIPLRGGPDAAKYREHERKLTSLQARLQKARQELVKLERREQKNERNGKQRRKKRNKKNRRKNANQLPVISPNDSLAMKAAKRRVRLMMTDLRKLRTNAPAPRVAMGVKEAANAFDSRVFIKGEVNDQGKVVPRGFVTVVHVEKAPAISGSTSGRLELAKWLTDESNPLTARVMVNRIWAHLFGRGIVGTVDNFGQLGERPSHPQLLDYLAIQFMKSGWNVKATIKSIMLSRAYGLATSHDPANYTTDPGNRFIWRSSRRRLDAESIRDAILAVSGQLDLTRPESSPVQKLNGEIGRQVSVGSLQNNLTCRSVYLPILRQAMPVMLKVFDVADPSLIVGQRDVTTVPTQALFMMNSPFVMKQAELTARKLFNNRSMNDGQRVELAYQLMVSRSPSPAEKARVLKFINQHREQLGKSVSPGSEEDLVGWTSFCQALFASAEFRYLY
ncbi:MAG: PSD1 and planctomycete cytochrome C domain-containing protein [Planctomycetaceae bacterium]